ncbi:MAG TPA: hypothetical protein VLF59_01125 [Candidatus Saccharimonadales bacterium]|nr:hypothetical protein [Candidatus Saccharimonadales bacterium]
MTQTIETPQTPSHDEYAIVATFSEQSLDKLALIQDQLSERLGDVIWLTPRAALHSTLMEIICDRDYGRTPRKQIFTDWHNTYSLAMSETLAEIKPFELDFTQLEVSQRAIIARLADSRAFNDIRAKILSNIDLPEGTKLPPDITHCSLARFSKPVDLESVLHKTEDVQVHFTQKITGFSLLKDLGPPTFDPKLIQSYSLSGTLIPIKSR